MNNTIGPSFSEANNYDWIYYEGNKNRSSSPEVFCKKVFWSFTKFTGKHLCQSLFFNKVEGLTSATTLERKLWHSFFLEDFAKFLRIPFYRPLAASVKNMHLGSKQLKALINTPCLKANEMMQNSVGNCWLGSSNRKRSIKKGVLKNFVKFQVKHLCQSLFFRHF